LLHHLYDNNIPFALATSCSQKSFDTKTLLHGEVFRLFEHKVIGPADPEVKHGKPAPDIFLVGARRFSDCPKPENVSRASQINCVHPILQNIPVLSLRGRAKRLSSCEASWNASCDGSESARETKAKRRCNYCHQVFA